MIAVDHPELAAVNARRATSPNGPGHFFLTEKGRGVRIRLDHMLLAETDRAVVLKEVGRTVYDPVFYVPREDVAMGQLVPVPSLTTHCPVKGAASYFALAGEDAPWIAWSYETPVPYAEAISGLLAFDTSRVTLEIAPTALTCPLP
ncbi:MAG: DUF427 domain-containing protein [Bacteroidota bacterium]